MLSIKSSMGQQLQFASYTLSEYTSPIKTSNNKYEGYYENSEQPLSGRIIRDLSAKTLTVKFMDATEWVCKYSKVATSTRNSSHLGNILSTTYTGKWVDDGTPAEFVVEKSGNSCIIFVRAGRAVDKDYGIDTWRRIYTFVTGNCFN